MRTIRLYGMLGKKYGRVHRLHVTSVGEAIRALSANFKEFRQDVIDSKGIAGYEVWDGSHSLGEDTPDDFVKKGGGTIKIIPRIVGGGGAVKIITGIVLVVVGTWMAQGWMVNIGTSLILGGVVDLMTKTSSGKSIQSDSDNTQSYLFSGTMNTTKQGNPVFIAYGTHLLGSQVISASLTTSDVPV